MQYYGLKSVVASRKQPIALGTASESFFTPEAKVTPYIEPTFTKEEYPSERPTILLVSAVGASGKTFTAQALAHDTGLPVLDLAKHKPVADNTLTGILTTAYPIESIGPVLDGIRKGTHGIIIDGIDEGRSKTTEQGFEAFLDDLVQRSSGSPVTSIVIFGRSQALLSTWVYLADKGVDVGLIRLDPFNLDQAKAYIDAYVGPMDETRRAMYAQARDGVLEKLGAAFASADKKDVAFLSFIGYPPVLDAIATLLRTESNYHRVSQALSGSADGNLEVRLLIQIADFLLKREREEKALPNFIDEIANSAGGSTAQRLRDGLYGREEQCARVLARGLGQAFPRRVVEDLALNDRYEKALATWCPEHPFLEDNRVRNAVFEAVCVARCTLSGISEYQQLATSYTSRNQPTYHLLYILAELVEGAKVGSGSLNMLIQACSDFMGKGRELEIEVSGLSWDEPDVPAESVADLEIRVSVCNGEQTRRFGFRGTVSTSDRVPLGPVLVNTTVTVPCGVVLHGHPALDCAGTCRITAKSARFETDVVIRAVPQAAEGVEVGLFLDVEEALGHADTVALKAGSMEIACVKHSLAYPLAQYAKKRKKPIADPKLQMKFRRLRRILQEFASHSRGGLAKYRDKIEHERVLRGSVGENVLAQLGKEGVLYTDPKFYYVDSDKLASVLGTTWQEIRQYEMSPSTEAFLRRVP